MNQTVVLLGLALALILLLVLWPRGKCGRRGAETSLALSSCAECAGPREGELSAELLDQLTLTPEQLARRRSWPHRAGLSQWQRNQEKTQFWREVNSTCPSAGTMYPDWY